MFPHDLPPKNSPSSGATGGDYFDHRRHRSPRNFSPEVNNVIEELYKTCSNEVFRRGAWKIFGDAEGLSELHKAGWVLANHSPDTTP